MRSSHIRRWAIALLLLAAMMLPAAQAVVVLDNPWLERAPINIAHQGGAKEAPSNTLFAFKRADDLGADVLELDVHATVDGHLVVIHDTTVDRTTDGGGRVDQMTLEQIKELDAAFWWSPGTVDCNNPDNCDWVYRGVATGDVEPPEGYEANDFKVPTLREVLDTFPAAFINIEIKRTAPDTVPYEAELAGLLREFGRVDDVIVVSFYDQAVEAFKLLAPEIHTATATVETAMFWATTQNEAPGAPNPRYVALQVPIVFEGITVVTEDFVNNANANGLAVHVWTIDDADTMCWLLSIGVQGIMTDRPSLLESILNPTPTEVGGPPPHAKGPKPPEHSKDKGRPDHSKPPEPAPDPCAS